MRSTFVYNACWLHVSNFLRPTTAIFELGLPADPRMMPPEFRDDIANDSGVTVLTDIETNRQTQSQTDTTDNNTPSLLYAARMINISTLQQRKLRSS